MAALIVPGVLSKLLALCAIALRRRLVAGCFDLLSSDSQLHGSGIQTTCPTGRNSSTAIGRRHSCYENRSQYCPKPCFSSELLNFPPGRD